MFSDFGNEFDSFNSQNFAIHFRKLLLSGAAVGIFSLYSAGVALAQQIEIPESASTGAPNTPHHALCVSDAGVIGFNDNTGGGNQPRNRARTCNTNGANNQFVPISQLTFTDGGTGTVEVGSTGVALGTGAGLDIGGTSKVTGLSTMIGGADITGGLKTIMAVSPMPGPFPVFPRWMQLEISPPQQPLRGQR
ncbi:MAG: hypothetical protein ACR2OR_06035 [Hyphomicrobiales bacterium]